MEKDEMKILKDTVHGDVYLSYSDCKLIDTPEIQRLRRVSQLGTVQWAYPGAVHTRFEHSIGTAYLALRIARNVLFERDEIKLLKSIRNKLSAATIFHDSGHLPFSHCLEEATQGRIVDHKERSAKIAERVIDNISDSDPNISLSGEEIANIIREDREDYLSDIISGTLDADRLDYLLRDQLHTGVTYGGIDLRIVSLFRKRLNRLVIDERGITPAETVLHSRYVLRAIMYDHKTTRLVQTMILRAFEYATGRDDINKKKTMSTKEISEWDDHRFLSELRRYTYSDDLVDMIRTRSLPKLAGIALTNYLKNQGRQGEVERVTPDKRWSWENKIVENLNKNGKSVEPYEILIDIGQKDRYAIKEAMVPVYSGEERQGELEKVSGIAADISSQYLKLWGLRLYAPEKVKERARKEFSEVTEGIRLEKPSRVRIPYSEFR